MQSDRTWVHLWQLHPDISEAVKFRKSWRSLQVWVKAGKDNHWILVRKFSEPTFFWGLQSCVYSVEVHTDGADGCIDLKIFVGVKLIDAKGQQQVHSPTNGLQDDFITKQEVPTLVPHKHPTFWKAVPHIFNIHPPLPTLPSSVPSPTPTPSLLGLDAKEGLWRFFEGFPRHISMANLACYSRAGIAKSSSLIVVSQEAKPEYKQLCRCVKG